MNIQFHTRDYAAKCVVGYQGASDAVNHSVWNDQTVELPTRLNILHMISVLTGTDFMKLNNLKEDSLQDCCGFTPSKSFIYCGSGV